MSVKSADEDACLVPISVRYVSAVILKVEMQEAFLICDHVYTAM